MTYVRKTKDEYRIMGNYGSGFEEVCAEETTTDARRCLKDYQENEPQYLFYIHKARVMKGVTQ